MFYAPSQAGDPRSVFLERLRYHGLPAHGIAAVDMNARDESGYNPRAVGDNGNAFGILQWNGPRKAELMRYAARQGRDPGDPSVQADFFVYEANGPERQAWQNTLAEPDPGRAGAVFVRDFERPAAEHLRSRAAKYAGGDVAGILSGPATMSSRGGGSSAYDFMSGSGGSGINLLDLDIPEPTAKDRFLVGMSGLGEALVAGGAGHGANFAQTDAFLRGQQERAIFQAAKEKYGQGGGTSPNATLDWIAGQGHQDLVDLVRAGGMTAEDAAKEAVQRGPVAGMDPNAPQLDKDQLIAVNTLRDEVDVKLSPFRETLNAAQNIYSAAEGQGGASDTVLAQQFAKLLDPTSVVREGELATIMASGGTLGAFLERVKGELSQNGDKLTAPTKRELVNLTHEILEARRNSARGVAERYGSRLDAQRIPRAWLMLEDLDQELTRPDIPDDAPAGAASRTAVINPNVGAAPPAGAAAAEPGVPRLPGIPAWVGGDDF